MNYSDLIVAEDTASANKRTAYDAARKADQDLADASKAEAVASSALAAGLSLAGPDGVVDVSPAGVRVFTSDGHTVTVRKPVDKTAPVPSPSPDPNPAPAPEVPAAPAADAQVVAQPATPA